MDSMPYNNNYNMEDQKPIFTTASETKVTSTTDAFTAPECRGMGGNQDSVFSPLAPPFQSRGGDLLNLLAQQEPRAGDTAPTAANMEEMMMNFRMNGSDLFFDDAEGTHGSHEYYMGNNRTESMGPQSWPEGNNVSSSTRNGEMFDTFDFLVKSVSSANNYISMLTREQLSILRSIRPSLLYELLQEVAKVRSDKRLRRALPNECAFCKNNGENEECYSSHALKDWRGRVLCPVLRAFRCPRCDATGDRAHTIKYCPENIATTASDRNSLTNRRRVPTSLLLNGAGAPSGPLRTHTAPPTPAGGPAPSPVSVLTNSSLWSNFGMN